MYKKNRGSVLSARPSTVYTKPLFFRAGNGGVSPAFSIKRDGKELVTSWMKRLFHPQGRVPVSSATPHLSISLLNLKLIQNLTSLIGLPSRVNFSLSAWGSFEPFSRIGGVVSSRAIFSTETHKQARPVTSKTPTIAISI